MKKVIITFEVTSDKIIVVATGSKGKVETIDLTNTDMALELISLLENIRDHKLKITK